VIGILGMAGGWLPTDITTAFQRLGLPAPMITDVSVDGTGNYPGDDADAEIALDIQVAAASYTIATGHAATIRVYWSQEMGTALTRAAHEGCAVFSMSWGNPEEMWGSYAAHQMEIDAFSAVHSHGMLSIAASGDNNADDGRRSPSVDCPACCPHVLGCGGTTKHRNGHETAWNNNPGHSNGEGTGGGYSQYFPHQTWQIGAPRAPIGLGRMVPDVAANADPNTGLEIVKNGETIWVGGTSVVAPLYAGLIAAVYGPKPGWISPELYKSPGWFVDITSGENGTYAARAGPDPVTGLGVPIGHKLKAG